MQTFELNTEEVEILRDIAKRQLHELDVEVLHTDSHEFKNMLKHRKTVLAGLLERLSLAAVES